MNLLKLKQAIWADLAPTEGGYLVSGGMIEEIVDRVVEDVEKATKGELSHGEFCAKSRPDFYKECALCYIERIFKQFRGEGGEEKEVCDKCGKEIEQCV